MWQRKFTYKKIGPYLRPIIPITLKHDGRELNYVALLDSGADFNIFHSEIAEIIGINLDDVEKSYFSGIKRSAQGVRYMTVIEIGIDDYTFNAPVYFSPDISPDGFGIIGQQGFFDHFKITMHYKARDIELKK